MNFEECVLTNGAVVAAPCEGGQISQEANRCPVGRGAEVGADPLTGKTVPHMPPAHGEVKSVEQ